MSTGICVPSRLTARRSSQVPIGLATPAAWKRARSASWAARRPSGTSSSTGAPTSSSRRYPNSSSARGLAARIVPSSATASTASGSAAEKRSNSPIWAAAVSNVSPRAGAPSSMIGARPANLARRGGRSAGGCRRSGGEGQLVLTRSAGRRSCRRPRRRRRCRGRRRSGRPRSLIGRGRRRGRGRSSSGPRRRRRRPRRDRPRPGRRPAPVAIVSAPKPPRTRSFPAPASIVSEPVPAAIRSSPSPVTIRSAPGPPQMTSLPPPPSIVSAPRRPRMTSSPGVPDDHVVTGGAVDRRLERAERAQHRLRDRHGDRARGRRLPVGDDVGEGVRPARAGRGRVADLAGVGPVGDELRGAARGGADGDDRERLAGLVRRPGGVVGEHVDDHGGARGDGGRVAGRPRRVVDGGHGDDQLRGVGAAGSVGDGVLERVRAGEVGLRHVDDGAPVRAPPTRPRARARSTAVTVSASPSGSASFATTSTLDRPVLGHRGGVVLRLRVVVDGRDRDRDRGRRGHALAVARPVGERVGAVLVDARRVAEQPAGRRGGPERALRHDLVR